MRLALPVKMAMTAACCAGFAALAVAQNDPPAAVGERPADTATSPTSQTPASSAPRSPSAAPLKASERLREGTKLTDVTGTITSVGADSVTFAPEGGKESYKLLQNLALERISRTLEEQRGSGKWIASGLITEYKGTNFVLITKAQLQGSDSASGAR